MLQKPEWLKNFKISDFQCRCKDCARDPDRPHTKIEIIRAVQDLRDHLGKPLIVTCGVRCEKRNKEVGGSRESRHLPANADAVDIAFSGAREAYMIIDWAIDYVGMMNTLLFTAFEVCADGHIHLDARPGDRLFLPCK